MTEAQALEQAKQRQRITNAFHRVFKAADGTAVLDYLKDYFRFDKPVFQRSPTHQFDALHAAIRDGQREVILFIEAKLAEPAKGDADIEKPETKVLR